MYARNGSNPVAGEELRWVIQIRRLLEEELVSEEAQEEEEGEEDDGAGGIPPPTTIFRVPTPWLAGKSEYCYRPQLVGIGPYHRWRPELLPMDRSKISVARRVRRQLLRHGGGGPHFQHVVDHLARLEHRLRASYHGCIDCDGETLAWATAIDASFLLGFLQDQLVRRPGGCGGGKVPHLAGSKVGRTCAHDMALRDLVMLENQMPLWPLRLLLEAQHPQAVANELLTEMAAALVKELCPFHMMPQRDPPFVDVVLQSPHLLGLLYDVVVPRQRRRFGMEETAGMEVEEAAESEGLLRRLSSCLALAVTSGPARFLVGLARLGLITQLPVLWSLRHCVEHLISSGQEEPPRPGDDEDRPLMAEEIAIPSATELAAAGVKFVPAGGGPLSVAFDSATAALRLPTVSLDANTEVTLRNLVAYELSSPAAAGPPALARYVELMNGIVDAGEDVRVLRESGVVRNGLRSDGEAAEVWNGMSRRVRLGRVAPLDGAIEGVNRYYHGRWRAKVGRLLLLLRRRRGQGGSLEASCSCAALMATVLLLFVVGLHGFCLLHDCGRPRSSATPPS